MTKETDDLFDDEVTTGATLDSGTTVGGNQVYHLGNDGQGSGLDAEKVDGSDVATPGDTWTLSPSVKDGGVSQGGFATPSSDPMGVGFDSNECIWHTDTAAVSIYQLDQVGTVITQYGSPGTDPTGVAFDSNDCVWNADEDYNYGSIYQLNKSSSVQSSFATPSDTPLGISVDLNGCVWHSQGGASESIYQTDQTGTIQTGFACPCVSPQGLAIGSDNCLWHISSSAGGYLFKMTKGGTVEKTIGEGVLPNDDSSPKGMDFDSVDSIWIAGVSTTSIYEITSGATFYQLNTKQ